MMATVHQAVVYQCSCSINIILLTAPIIPVVTSIYYVYLSVGIWPDDYKNEGTNPRRLCHVYHIHDMYIHGNVHTRTNA